MKALLVVPARLGSTRFPRKVLAPLGGKPLVQWCWQAARAAGMGEVLVATESQEVAQAVRSFGGEAVLTSPSCRSGSDRVHEAAKGRREELIVNVQGDQPFLDPEAIRSTLLLLEREPSLDIATAVSPLTERSKLEDANVVKVAMTEAGRCLYFSRAPIPFERSP
ncbi:MAG: NTP transferase domain-containing protein, partial [Elusimicrobia bacterium]|nr:NTP transferase domain-containing protein [Elusimicrobiota bacterium]